MKKFLSKKFVDKAFEIGILIKSIFGFFEVLVGIAFAISGKLIVNNVVIALTQQEVSEDPKDLIANYLIRISNNFSTGTNLFAISYLIFHGLTNIILAVALVKNKIWAYHWALTGFSLFIIYQVFRYFDTHSSLLLFLTLFDILVVIVIMLEYNSKKKKRKLAQLTAVV